MRISIDTIVILGEPKEIIIKEQIRKIISSKENDSYIENNLANDTDKIKKIYSQAGYNFAKVNTKIRKVDDKRLDLILEIDRGKITKISKISFTGNKKVKRKRLRDVIASEENKFWKFITRNTRFNQNLVNLDIRLLNNYYKSIGYYDVKINSNTAELVDSGDIRFNLYN